MSETPLAMTVFTFYISYICVFCSFYFIFHFLFLLYRWISIQNGLFYNVWFIYTVYTLTGHFIRYTLLVVGWTPFSFRTALILRGIDSTRCWKQSSEILVHIDMIASRSCCRFVACTTNIFMEREYPVPPHPKGALLDWDLVTVETIWVKWTHCQRNQSEMIWALWHGALSCWK